MMRRVVAATCLVLVAVLASGCGSTADPTAPRDVREVDGVDRPSEVTAERDLDSPSRGLPCAAQRAEPVRLCGAATDNYKASYNDDDRPERRTWLAIHEVEVDGVRWRPVPGTPLAADELELERVDGAEGRRTARVEIAVGPGDAVTLRTGPQRGLWGPLLTIDSARALEREAVVVRLAFGDADAVDVEYRYDEALAAAPEDSLEHRGPGGRWYVAGIATATNLELGWE